MPVADAYSTEFRAALPPDMLLRTLVHDHTRDFADAGYEIETHSSDGLALTCRYVPTIVYRVPVALAVVVFMLGVFGSDTVDGASRAGTIAGVLVLIAIALAVVVRRTDRVTVSLHPGTDGTTTVLVSGQANRDLRDLLTQIASALTPVVAARS